MKEEDIIGILVVCLLVGGIIGTTQYYKINSIAENALDKWNETQQLLSSEREKSFDIIEGLITINHNEFCLNRTFNYKNCKPICEELKG